MKKIMMRGLLGILMINLSITVLAQPVSEKTIILGKKILSESKIKLEYITNNSGYTVEVIIDDAQLETPPKIEAKQTLTFTSECTKIQVNPIGTKDRNAGQFLWNKRKTRNEWEKLQANANTSLSDSDSGTKNEESNKTADKLDAKKNVEQSSQTNVNSGTGTKGKQSKKASSKSETKTTTRVKKKKKIDREKVFASFIKKIDEDSYWSEDSIEKDVKTINNYIESIKEGAIDTESFLGKKDLNDYIRSESEKISVFKDKQSVSIDDFLSAYNYETDSNVSYKDSLKHILEEKILKRERIIEDLKKSIASIEESKRFDLTKLNGQTIIYIGIAAVLIVLVVGFCLLAKRKKNRKTSVDVRDASTNEASPAIVIKKTTNTLLKKQSLDDVVNNNAYLKIECTDFCSDSAVKYIYIKNTCIKDIYNMYADDLRNPNNPKEDGCMVLGRWIHDNGTNDYSVSLEEIVRPGDDAVFQEYELNFGGKIKLKVAEKLRKLRKDTNLQYDLTCWVHSHPGLGVFFSNSDTGVQMQLKHPSHPNFLTAIVVDILTPQQELGIFTFKHDSSINSRNDLTKIYSLEELHKWAVESDRNSYKPEDHYNILEKVEKLNEWCQGIQLSNGAIIDISSITVEQNTGLTGWIHGFKTQNGDQCEFVVNSVSNEKCIPDNELLGCLIIGTHCSIPSIRKTISECADKIKFVMFYSIKDEVVTTIPVIDSQLGMNEKYYSEEKLEDLKIWTRRKR